MKSILQSIALLSAVALVTSCDSSSGGGAANIGVPTPAPQVGASGSGVKGIIDGATVEFFDADGDKVGSSLTVNGTYDMVFDSAAVTAGIAYPVRVVITGGSAKCDYINPDDSGNDCRTGNPAPNAFVAFGDSYALPAGFQLRAIISAGTDSSNLTNIAHANPATEIAVLKALEKAGVTDAADLTTDQVDEANRAIAGLIQLITGVDLGGVDITSINPGDLTGSGGSLTDAQLAVAGFAAAIVADQGDGESITATIARLTAGITIDADGRVNATGAQLAGITRAVANGLRVAAARTSNAGIKSAAVTALNNVALFTRIGTGIVKAPKAPANQTDGDKATRELVVSIGNVVENLLLSTGAEGSSDTVSATEALAAELEAVRLASSGNATKAFTRLDAALKTAAATIDGSAGETTTVEQVKEEGDLDDGVEFTLTKADGVFTVTDVSSRWPKNAGTADCTTGCVIITAASGTAGAAGFDTGDLVMTTTNGTTTTQTFTGSVSYTIGTETSAAALSGTLTGATASSPAYTLNGTLSDIVIGGTGDLNASDVTGGYTFSVGFVSSSVPSLTLAFSGAIGAAAQDITLTAGTAAVNINVTRDENVDAHKITNGNGATLALTVTDGVVTVGENNVIGTFTFPVTVDGQTSAAVTATLDNDGVVTYSSDGSIQFLPAILF